MYETALIIIFSSIVGALLGVATSAVMLRRRLRAELERDKAEFEFTKKDLSYALNEQLGRIRESIVSSVEAYESAVKAVEEKLPAVGNRQRAIDHPAEPKQLELKDVADHDRELWGKGPINGAANEDEADLKSRVFSTGGVGI